MALEPFTSIRENSIAKNLLFLGKFVLEIKEGQLFVEVIHGSRIVKLEISSSLALNLDFFGLGTGFEAF